MLIGNRLHWGIGRYISLPQQDFSQSPGSAKRSMLVDCKKLQQIVTFIDLTLDSQRWIACPEVNLADTAVTPWALRGQGLLHGADLQLRTLGYSQIFRSL